MSARAGSCIGQCTSWHAAVPLASTSSANPRQLPASAASGLDHATAVSLGAAGWEGADAASQVSSLLKLTAPDTPTRCSASIMYELKRSGMWRSLAGLQCCSHPPYQTDCNPLADSMLFVWQVTAADLGNNFLLEASSLGGSRAQAATDLLQVDALYDLVGA